MGAHCCKSDATTEGEIQNAPQDAREDTRTDMDIATIVKLQARIRGWLGRRFAHRLRSKYSEGYGAGMNDHDFHTGEANYDNQNVQLQRAQLGAFVYKDLQFELTLGNREERDT